MKVCALNSRIVTASAMSLDALKALKEKLKKEKQDVSTKLEKKYITKAELDASRLLKLREEEEREAQAKASSGERQASMHARNHA